MKIRVGAPLIALLMIVGCSGQPAGRNEPKEESPHAQEHEEEGRKENVLRIDPGMLRDLHVTTAQVESRPAGLGETMLGELQVDENADAEVGTPIPGRLVKILASVGQRVAVGGVLAEVQSVELGKARGEYLSATAAKELSRRTLERKRKLAEEGVVARKDVLEAEADAKAAEARLGSSRAVLGTLGLGEATIRGSSDTSAFQLRSPVAGTVIERNAVMGKFVEPAHELFHIADLSRLWLIVHAFERDAVRVRIGATVAVTLAALPGRSFSGTTILVGRQVDAASRTVPVRIEMANDDDALRPGMSASAWVPLGDETQHVVTVPAIALQRLQDRWVTFVPMQEGVFEIRPVGRGRDLGNEVEVVSGIGPGETVVVAGSFLLKAEAERARGETEEHEH